MAIKNNSFTATRSVAPVRPGSAGDMSVEDFKRWVKRFDVDKDGRISREELREAIRSLGGRFSWWKSKKGIEDVDYDGNGYIDYDEIDGLISFAQKNLGMKIAAY